MISFTSIYNNANNQLVEPLTDFEYIKSLTKLIEPISNEANAGNKKIINDISLKYNKDRWEYTPILFYKIDDTIIARIDCLDTCLIFTPKVILDIVLKSTNKTIRDYIDSDKASSIFEDFGVKVFSGYDTNINDVIQDASYVSIFSAVKMISYVKVVDLICNTALEQK